MQAVEDHPAKFSKPVLAVIQAALEAEDRRALRPMAVFDPFAGTGLVHGLATVHGLHTWGVELEPEWAACHPATVVGNALALPFATGSMDGLVTSVCYGNRLSDSHAAKDQCKTCEGRGKIVDGDGELPALVECKVCKGYGLSRRNTYTHRLQAALRDPDHKLHPDNAGTLLWGRRYRQFHEAAYLEALRCIRPGGFAIVNISNFLETSGKVTVEHKVSEWTMNAWLRLQVRLTSSTPVPTQRNKQGANRDTRAEHEHVMVFRVPEDYQPQLI